MAPPDREAAAKRIQDLGPLDVAVYTDGSRLDTGAGYGFVVYRGRFKIAEGSGSAGEATDIYDAEVLGAARDTGTSTTTTPGSTTTTRQRSVAAAARRPQPTSSSARTPGNVGSPG